MATGDLVGGLTTPDTIGAIYSLTSNPGGFFAISGTNLVQAINTPNGVYPITIQAVISGGVVVTTPFVLTFSGAVSDLSDPVPIIF
jgi:hypothetical protein